MQIREQNRINFAANRRRCSLFCATIAIVFVASSMPLIAQSAADEAPAAATATVTGTFVAAPAATQTPTKEAENKAAPKKDAALGASDGGKVNEGAVLGFRQSEVAAQMTELEERMYRLSEAIKQLEPENSSRLMLGLKFAREELILHQMKETQALLDKLSLGEALTEQKHLMSKLQRLHDMLLSADLDLQMRLERLRQVREILRRLEKAIAEEEREQRDSRSAAGLTAQVDHLQKLRAALERLIKEQKGHVEQGKQLADVATPDEEQTKAIDGAATAQAATRDASQKLSAAESQAGTKLEQLDKAVDEMQLAGKSLASKAAPPALPHQQEALDALKRQLAAITGELAATEAELTAEKFTALQKEQAGNRQFTGDISELVRKLGDSGAAALGNMEASTGSMSGAEQRLGQRQAEPAAADQMAAIESLKKARKQLDGELAKLLDQLRAEIKRRVLEDLALMLEKQIAIRESTVMLSSRIEGGGRQILSSIIALSASEGRIINVADELLALIEETEFGIALPAALSMVREGMSGVKASLAAADASEQVVAREREIETDLKDLLGAMKQLPAKGRSKDGDAPDGDGNGNDRERELNRLVAELKMIRVVQIRVNRSTLTTDERRPAQLDALTADVRRQIEGVMNQQDDVRDVTERLLSERGEELGIQ